MGGVGNAVFEYRDVPGFRFALFVDEVHAGGALRKVSAHGEIVARLVFGKGAQPLRADAFRKAGDLKLRAGERAELRIRRPAVPDDQKNPQREQHRRDRAEDDQQLFLSFHNNSFLRHYTIFSAPGASGGARSPPQFYKICRFSWNTQYIVFHGFFLTQDIDIRRNECYNRSLPVEENIKNFRAEKESYNVSGRKARRTDRGV